MRYLALATDYDGTLAHDGQVADDTWKAVRQLRESGRKVLLITGRELDDLQKICPHFELFDRIVAENGGLLYHPAKREEKVLVAPGWLREPLINEIERTIAAHEAGDQSANGQNGPVKVYWAGPNLLLILQDTTNSVTTSPTNRPAHAAGALDQGAACVARQGWQGIERRTPVGMLNLERVMDHVANIDGHLLTGREGHTHVAGRMAGQWQQADTRRDLLFTVSQVEPFGFRQWQEFVGQVGSLREHVGVREVVPIGAAEPVARARVAQMCSVTSAAGCPADMVAVGMTDHDRVDVRG